MGGEGGEGKERKEERKGGKEEGEKKNFFIYGWHVTSVFKFYQLALAHGFSWRFLPPFTDGMEKSDC